MEEVQPVVGGREGTVRREREQRGRNDVFDESRLI